jgi:hypothetical protein
MMPYCITAGRRAQSNAEKRGTARRNKKYFLKFTLCRSDGIGIKKVNYRLVCTRFFVYK